MIAKLLETLTGKDDLERVAYKENLGLLNEYLKTRRILIPRKPGQFLDAASFTPTQLQEMIVKGMEELADLPFEPWVLEIEGKKRLPAFSSQKKVEIFSGKMATRLNKVFGLACAEFLFADIQRELDVDFVDLNLFSEKSWEIGVRKQTPT
jgi:hypothetical protein